MKRDISIAEETRAEAGKVVAQQLEPRAKEAIVRLLSNSQHGHVFGSQLERQTPRPEGVAPADWRGAVKRAKRALLEEGVLEMRQVRVRATNTAFALRDVPAPTRDDRAERAARARKRLAERENNLGFGGPRAPGGAGLLDNERGAS